DVRTGSDDDRMVSFLVVKAIRRHDRATGRRLLFGTAAWCGCVQNSWSICEANAKARPCVARPFSDDPHARGSTRP
ncbi:hypothetical protein, partial [Klebsiella michiganensis]